MNKITPIILIGLVAAVITGTIYFATQKAFADPICQQFAKAQGWRYTNLQPPDLILSGKNRAASNVTRDAQCIFSDAQGSKQAKNFNKLSGSFLKDTLINLGLQMDLVFVIAAVITAFVWGGVKKLLSPGREA